MDADRVADLLRAFSTRPSRRGMSRGLVALLLGSALPAGHGPPETTAKKKHKKKKKRQSQSPPPAVPPASPPPPPCTPHCIGTVCGDDGCGGTCCQGCCSGGECKPGTAHALCGRGGAACAACPDLEQCSPAGVCEQRCGLAGGNCRVFTTSSTHTGNLGGLAGADAICNDRAEEAGFERRFRAYLADGGSSPSSRLVPQLGPYLLVTGQKVADTWNDLDESHLDHAIDRDEHGDAVPRGEMVWVWTGTLSDNCALWSFDTVDQFAYVGDPTATNSTWAITARISCDKRKRLYCFQQS